MSAAPSSWDRKQEALAKTRRPRPMTRFPDTLEKLLALPAWRGSTVEPSYTGEFLVIRHPSGAEMRLLRDVFERMAQEKKAKEAERAKVEARRAAKRAAKGMTRHTNAQ